jgi:hypothetical protein
MLCSTEEKIKLTKVSRLQKGNLTYFGQMQKIAKISQINKKFAFEKV